MMKSHRSDIKDVKRIGIDKIIKQNQIIDNNLKSQV